MFNLIITSLVFGSLMLFVGFKAGSQYEKHLK